MSYANGWAAINLEMPPQVPRIEFDAESHWALVRRVTEIDVTATSSPESQRAAQSAFIHAWDYDLRLAPLIGHNELDAKRTYMGHSEYADGGVDRDDHTSAAFATPEEALAFDPQETYGSQDKATLVERFNDHYRSQRALYPDLVNSTGVYVSLFSGLIAIYGWDMLLTLAGMDPEGLGRVAERYASWMQPYFDAVAESEATVIYSHDDIVWSAGPAIRPAWYRRYIFPHYQRYWAPLLEAGKKPIFVSDGNYTEFIDDIAACGAQGFFLEPLTDLAYLTERYGRTHIIVGNADTRILLRGNRREIRQEVERCMRLGRDCPGFFMSVTNMIPANTPVESALYYNQVYEELRER